MAKFIYPVCYLDDMGTVVTRERCLSKDEAQKFLKKINRGITSELYNPREPRMYWKRVVVIHSDDFTNKKCKGFERDVYDLDVFDGTVEGADYRNCPWAGRANLIWFDDKFELYHTTNLGYTGEEGFYLVDINARRK